MTTPVQSLVSVYPAFVSALPPVREEALSFASKISFSEEVTSFVPEVSAETTSALSERSVSVISLPVAAEESETVVSLPVVEESVSEEIASHEEVVMHHVCKGHSEVVKKNIATAKKAAKEADKALKQHEGNQEIATVETKVTGQMKETSNMFNKLFRALFNRYTVTVSYKHVDDSAQCPHHKA